jgi:hypothetical protein
MGLFHLLVALLHRCGCRSLTLIDSLDYLLKVSGTTHTFDNTLFRGDFPGIAAREETILGAFVRIRDKQQQQQQQQQGMTGAGRKEEMNGTRWKQRPPEIGQETQHRTRKRKEA